MIELEKINFNNYTEPGLSKEILMQLQKNIENAINKKNVMTRNFDRQNITVSTGWGSTEIPLSTTNSLGEKITSVQNGIKIGKGISKVLVSCYFNGIGHPEALGDKSVGLMKNGNGVGSVYQSGDVTSGYACASISPILVDVSENDVFSLTIASGGAGTFEILGGSLTVEAVL